MSRTDLESSLRWDWGSTANVLGPVVLNCRDRSVKDRLLARGESRSWVYLLPFLASVFPTSGVLLVYCLVYELLNHPVEMEDERVIWLVAGVAYIVSCAAIVRLTFRRATKVSLALHRDGIRFRRKTYRFEDLLAIRGGQENGRIRVAALALCRLLGKFNPMYRDVVQSAEVTDAASLTLVLNDGRSCSLPGVGILCEPQDYGRFLDLIQISHPRLFEA
jgi:hypothetical protein